MRLLSIGFAIHTFRFWFVGFGLLGLVCWVCCVGLVWVGLVWVGLVWVGLLCCVCCVGLVWFGLVCCVGFV